MPQPPSYPWFAHPGNIISDFLAIILFFKQRFGHWPLPLSSGNKPTQLDPINRASSYLQTQEPTQGRIYKPSAGARAVKCCWPLPAQPVVVLGPGRTHYHLFVLSRFLCVLKWSLLFDKRRGLTTTGHSPSTGGMTADSLAQLFIHSHSASPDSLLYSLSTDCI
jgi:hypothetical protein